MQHDPAESAAGAAPPPQTPAEDVLCTGCGYDLRGLRIEANCPECGRPIRESIQGLRLAGADPRWLRRITRGSALFAWGWTLLVAAPVSVFLFAVIMHYAFLVGFGEWLFLALFIAAGVSFLAGLLLSAVGAFLLTMQDPRESLREAPLSARRLARVGMVGAVVAYLAMLPAATLLRITTAGEIVAFALGAAMLAGLTVGVVALLRTVSTLVERVPDPTGAKRLASTGKFMAVMLPLAVISNVAGSIGGASAAGAATVGPAVFGCFTFLLWLVIFAGCICLAVLLFKTMRQFRTCHRQAKISVAVRPQLAAATNVERRAVERTAEG